MQTMTLTRALLHALQNVEPTAWDAIAADDVLISSPAGFGMRGRAALKSWAVALARALGCTIELTDEHMAVDQDGDGRGFVTLTLNCKCDQELLDQAPRAYVWTSSETLLLTFESYRLVRIYIAGETLDLALRCLSLFAEAPAAPRVDASALR